MSTHLELDGQTGVLDIAVIDVLAQVEFLLSRAREIQRHILTVRGISTRSNANTRREAAQNVQRLAREMTAESRQLPSILKHLAYCANTLTRIAAGRS